MATLKTAPLWVIEVSVARPLGDPACLPVAVVSIAGMPAAEVAILIDIVGVAQTVSLDANGAWAGELAWPATGEPHTVSIHLVDEHGDIGDPVAETAVEG
jgi:hypothetical protein